MQTQISSGLKITFLVHFVVALVLGLVFLFIPETYGSLANYPVPDAFPYRLIGGVFLGLAVSSWLAYSETLYERVKIVVVMEMVWTSLGALINLWGVLFNGMPVIGWANVILMGAFAVAFSSFYFKK